MGIGGLLPLVSSITENVHLSKYSGKRVAVDTYVWLHKAAYSCAEELCRNIPTTKYIDYCMRNVEELKYHNITPILVFDGGLLPAKKQEEKKRYCIRKQYREKGEAYLKEKNYKAAKEAFQRAIDISPRIAQNLIDKLKEMEVQFIVAPYEADAQLTYLTKSGLVDFVITEDSDLLPYGCSTVVFKLDKSGNGKEVKIENLNSCTNPLSFEEFSHTQFRRMCILSGCDYLSSPPGLGIRTAHSLFSNSESYRDVIAHLRDSRSYTFPVSYEELYRRAELTFLHQRVWDPLTQSVIHLNPLTEDLLSEDLSFLGEHIEPELGYQIANGLCNPQTHQPWTKSLTLTKKIVPQKIFIQTKSKQSSRLENSYHTPLSEKVSKPFSTPRKHSSSLPSPAVIVEKIKEVDVDIIETQKVLVPASPEKSSLGKRQILDCADESSPPTKKQKIEPQKDTKPKFITSLFFSSANEQSKNHPLRQNRGKLQKMTLYPQKSRMNSALKRFKEKKNPSQE